MVLILAGMDEEVRSPVARLRLVAHHLCHSLTQIPNCVRLKARSGRPCTCGVVGRPCPKSGTSPHAVSDPAWLPSWCVFAFVLALSPEPFGRAPKDPAECACVRSRSLAAPPDATSLGADPDLVQNFSPPPPPRMVRVRANAPHLASDERPRQNRVAAELVGGRRLGDFIRTWRAPHPHLSRYPSRQIYRQTQRAPSRFFFSDSPISIARNETAVCGV